MKELSESDMKELDLLIETAQSHAQNGNFLWLETDKTYIAWRTRAKALLGEVLPKNSPDLKRIADRQKAGKPDLEFEEYAQMLLGVKQYFTDHQTA